MSERNAAVIMAGYLAGWDFYNGMWLSDLIADAAAHAGIPVRVLAAQRRISLRQSGGMPIVTPEMIAMFGPPQLVVMSL